MIGPGGYVLVVRDPYAFFLRYPGVEPEIVYGPYGGALNNGGELIELGQPVKLNKSGTLETLTLDRVAYGDGSSAAGDDDWPAEPMATAHRCTGCRPPSTATLVTVGSRERLHRGIRLCLNTCSSARSHRLQ
ncbi:MAG: hypothetical protein IIA65_03515, partial [Planctomycetes bacterium]|nr:hypothetical protein [Planctomycetota bacterium]